ncbi:hypothetical protein [Inquilinus sp. OTU3971]|uniref:hypothetical protein n=1 Tax=Inquilinus sp. OTU3971 TaxID=3043855 RepID=UPI00313D8DE9
MNPWLPGKTIIRDVAELAGLVSVLPNPLVAIDGVDGAGKTTLATKLSATLGWPAVDLDDHIGPKGRSYVDQIIFDDLAEAIRPRPVIFSGIHMLEVLDRVGARPDFLVYVVRLSQAGIPADLDLIERDLRPELTEGQDTPPKLGGVTPGKLMRSLWTYLPRWRPVTAADVVFAWP